MKVVLIEDQNLLSSTLDKALEQSHDIEIRRMSDKAITQCKLAVGTNRCRHHDVSKDGQRHECTRN